MLSPSPREFLAALMPPWAAMECARRGESWNVSAWTWYPSSASVAAAEAPARPVPTTMTLNLRLLLGLTNFMSDLYRSHFSAIGPSGILESRRGSADWVTGGSTSVVIASSLTDDAGENGDRER